MRNGHWKINAERPDKKEENIVAVYQAMLATIAGNVEKLMSSCNLTIITHADETRKLRKKLNSKFNQLTNFCTAL